ncbi:MAG: radical SAM family heme chaperone HemW, partial [Gemmataceae bacterium]
DRYLEALEAEMTSRLGSSTLIETLFLGGGTPTHLDPSQLQRLLDLLARWLPLNSGAEFTIEANPESFTGEKAHLLARSGVRRVSLGAQSFQDPILKSLDREHDAASIVRAVEWVRERAMTVSIDLIFAVPHQTLSDWRRDLEAAVHLRPEHISLYGLTYEKGTPLWKRRERSLLTPLSEDQELEMYEFGMGFLEEKGYEQYEISNFALERHRSRHNQTYWANEAYHGFGLGAARYIQGAREVNTRDLMGYIRKAIAGEDVTQNSETLSPRERARETLALQLRRMSGIERTAFREQTGFTVEELAREPLEWLIREGFLRDREGRVHLSGKGKPLADAVISQLLTGGARSSGEADGPA